MTFFAGNEQKTQPVASGTSSRQSRYERLVRAYSSDLYRFAYRLCGQDALAQDLAQETFLRAWRSFDSLRDDVAAKAWLITILRREHARLYKREPVSITDISDLNLLDDAPRPEDLCEDSALRAAIARLEPKHREPLVLQILGGYSCEEIAEWLATSEAAVMTQLFRARQKLKTLLAIDIKAT